MASRTTSTKTARQQRRSGFTLIELMFSVGITVLCLTILGAFFVFCTHCFATLFNYVDLDDVNRIAMDQLTRDVRQANCVKNYTTNQLVLTDSDNLDLSFTYDPTARTLTRAKSGASTVLLSECDRLSFAICQRNPVNGSYDVYPAATPATAKVVNVTWSCSRKIFGIKEDTESVQTARIVIRKQDRS
jgi:Tfp pilus assembly protein PilW